jgi:hypothetical protein
MIIRLDNEDGKIIGHWKLPDATPYPPRFIQKAYYVWGLCPLLESQIKRGGEVVKVHVYRRGTGLWSLDGTPSLEDIQQEKKANAA